MRAWDRGVTRDNKLDESLGMRLILGTEALSRERGHGVRAGESTDLLPSQPHLQNSASSVLTSYFSIDYDI